MHAQVDNRLWNMAQCGILKCPGFQHFQWPAPSATTQLPSNSDNDDYNGNGDHDEASDKGGFADTNAEGIAER